jgi:hypothetical protein
VLPNMPYQPLESGKKRVSSSSNEPLLKSAGHTRLDDIWP